MKKIFFALLFFLGGILVFNAGHGVEAQSFPSKTINWIVPYSPGGGVDVLTRALARVVGKDLKATVIVQNIPGGGARIGASYVYRSKPDGYTLGTFVSGSLIIPQKLFADAPYDVDKMTWIASPFQAPFGMWVSVKSPVKRLKDLKKLGRPIFIGEGGITASPVPPTILTMKALGIKYKYVTGYKGQAPMNPAVYRGELDFFVRTIPSQEAFKDFTRTIVTMSPKRHPLVPDIPTLEEQIGPAAKDIIPLSSGIYLIGMAPGTPRQPAEILENAILKALDDPTLLKWAKRAGFGGDLTRAGISKTQKIMKDYISTLTQSGDSLRAVMKPK
jgi:tripartite-type tricarboxylate transporter receptor subunit TctC